MSKPLSREKMLKAIEGYIKNYADSPNALSALESIKIYINAGEFNSDEVTVDVENFKKYLQHHKEGFYELDEETNRVEKIICVRLIFIEFFINQLGIVEPYSDGCIHCGATLSHAEKYYYENSCNKCEGKFSEDMSQGRAPCDFFERKLKKERK